MEGIPPFRAASASEGVSPTNVRSVVTTSRAIDELCNLRASEVVGQLAATAVGR
jgi:hypothetical protein